MTIKRYIILLVLTFVSSICFSQKVIQLTEQNGVYTIPCSINGVKRSLVFDTGASTVTISMGFADVLYNLGKLKVEDFKGFGESQVANGHIVNNTKIVLQSIEIAGLHIRNVDAVIIEGQNVPLLLGLSAIQKLGKVTLTGNKLIIESSSLGNSQLNQMRNQVSLYIKEHRFNDAIAILNKFEENDALEENDLFHLAQCYCFSEDFNKTLIYCQQWMGIYDDFGSQNEPDICYFMALAYQGLNSYYEADKWYTKAIKLIETGAINQEDIINALRLSQFYNHKANNYFIAKTYKECVEAYDIATQYRIRALGVDIINVCAGDVKDELLGGWLNIICMIYSTFLNKGDKAERYAVLAALCGNEEAKGFCKYYNIDYNNYFYLEKVRNK